MRQTFPIAVTGLGLEIPGWSNPSLLAALKEPVTYGEFEPAKLLGKKGLRYKDRATLLALCASHKALQDRGLLEPPAAELAGVGVCVSSNLGNMDTVCQESETIRREHVDSISPMNLPVASSNVIPASIAIRWGLKGVNLMLCNGATSGLDAIQIAASMLRSRRAEKMLVVGTEPLTPVAERLLWDCDPDNREVRAPFRCGELGVALILEPWQKGSARAPYGFVGDYGFVPPDGKLEGLPSGADVWFIPSQSSRRSRDFVTAAKNNGLAGVPTVDASGNTGEIYGALGVFQAATALLHLKESGKNRALLSNGLTFGDGLSYLELTAAL